jgi:3-deoxy-D-manno-octulosonic-acid transferase
MNLYHLAYTIVGAAGAAALVPPVWLHHKIRGGNLDQFYQRLGIYPPGLKQRFRGRPRLWLHAVSVGEVGAAVAVLKHLATHLTAGQVALSVATEQGFERAQDLAGQMASCFFAPIDVGWSNRRAMAMIRPNALILLETEIWPNLIIKARRAGVPVAIVNGRISVRTIKSYRKIKSLMRHTLSHVDRFSMISEQDAERIESIGAPPDRIVVNGNAKFDAQDAHIDPNLPQRMAELYHLEPETPVIVAGSTRSPEEQLLLDAYTVVRDAFPDTVLIIAPRHINRIEQIEQWVADRGLSCQRRSQLEPGSHPRRAPVVLLDTIGELASTYAVSSFVFCGGSLVPKGGQNLLEPAVWNKPVICGPSMEDFAEAYDLITRAGGCVTVTDSASLAAVALEWLRNPAETAKIGWAAGRAMEAHRGAALRHARVVDDLLNF